jgi:hypothetical protein
LGFFFLLLIFCVWGCKFHTSREISNHSRGILLTFYTVWRVVGLLILF